MTVSARMAIGQEKVGKETRAPKRKFTVHIMQAWSRYGVNPLGAVKAGPQALWQRMATEHQRAWERSDTDGAYRMLCWPSQARLAGQMNTSVQTIRRWTRALEAAGLIEVVVVAKPGATSCLRRCNYALVAPMRVSAMQAPRKRAPQSARGFARKDYVRASRAAAGVGGVVLGNAHHTPTSRLAVLERRDREQEAHIEKLAATNPQEAAAFRAIIEKQRAAASAQRDGVEALGGSDPDKIAVEVQRMIPGLKLGEAARMAREDPHALVQAITAFMDTDESRWRDPAKYFAGIFKNKAKEGRVRSLSHAA
jgi:hypothetical protein